MCNEKLEKVFMNLIDKFPESYKITEEFLDDVFHSMEMLNTDKTSMDSNLEFEELINLYVGEWVLRSIAISSKSTSCLQYTVTGFFVQISNTLTCILRLVKDGFDYQATILVRNLIEISYTLLTLIIEAESRNSFLEAARNSDEKTIWYKYFRFERMEKIIWKYISSIGNEDEVIFLKNMGSEIYHWLSSFVHNDFLSILLYSYSDVNSDDEIMKFNLQGHHVTRVSKILRQVIDIMFLVDMIFVKMLSDDKISVSKEDLCTETDGEEFWNQSIALFLIAKDYFLLLVENESNQIN